MNWLDIAVLVFLVVITFVGLKIGLIKAALSLAGIVVGVILAGRLYAPLAKILTFIPQENIAKVVAFAIILIVVIIIASILAALLKWIAKAVLLGWVNHLGGAVVGFIMGAIFCAAILALWAKYAGTPDILRESLLAGILLDHFPAILGLLPKEFESIRSFFQ
jgi:membrane protein required for colicin V production